MQSYHSNATTNINIRFELQNKKDISLRKMAERFNISLKTATKWSRRNFQGDVSSRPKNIHYALSEVLENLIISLRKQVWYSLDEIHEILLNQNENITRTTIYRVLKRNKINVVPAEEREKAKKFKEYEPGYLHIDVTYLPMIEGKKYYLFVAIDRATRLLYYEIYDNKNSESAVLFLKSCEEFFPFKIQKILTDNGLEFSNRLIKSKKGEYKAKKSLFDEECESHSIEHRLTQPASPKTNGMVERANGIIKQGTIKRKEYKNRLEMEEDLRKFLVYYNVSRRHGGIRKELGVSTPLKALEKWYLLKNEIFKIPLLDFKNKLVFLSPNYSFIVIQPCET